MQRVASSAAREVPSSSTPSVSLYVPWPMAAFAGVLAGVLLAWGTWWGLLFLAVPPLGWRGPRSWPLLACALAGLIAGGVSERSWAGRPDALQPWRGGLVTLTGQWDGQLLSLDEPPVRVALSPRPKQATGQLRVRGRLDLPAERRNPGGFDYRFWLRVQGVPEVLYGAQVLSSQPERGVRAWFSRGLHAGLPVQEGALMEAIELGDRHEVQETEVGGQNTRDAFARAGLSHLMALSGQNVALLIAAMTFLLTRTRLGLWRYGLQIALLIAYLWLVGPTPSITRAILSGAAVLLGLWVGRGKLEVLGVLGLAGTACLLVYPGWIFDVGFQLSFLAVLALTLTPRLAARFPGGWPDWLKLGLSGTLLAELGTWPVVAHNFGQLSLVALPANLLAEPIMAALVPLGFLAGLLGPLSVPVNWLVLPLARLLLGVVGLLGGAPAVPWGQISPAGWATYGVFALATVLWLVRRIRGAQLALVTLPCVLATALPAQLSKAHEIVFLDVGQGDATLIRLGHFNMLIDGGGTPRGDYDVGAGTVVPALRALGVNDLAVVVATHADSDHIEGLASVLRLLPVGQLWIGQPKEDDPVLAQVSGVARERHVPVRQVRRGDVMHAEDATLTVLWPQGPAWSEADNENSVAVKLQTPRFSALFLGDLPDPLEAELRPGHVDLLKAAHHGSRFSTGEAFLAQITPRDAVISVGRNTYGHPNTQVLERLAAHGVRVWRTDESGAVRWPIP